MPFLKVLSTVEPKALVIAAALINSATKLGLVDMVVTAGRNGQHKVGSLHYKDKALDFRTRHLAEPQKFALIAEMKTRLGPDYDVILENLGGANEHGHAEHDPK